MPHIRLDNVLMPEARKLTLARARRKVLAESATGDPLYAVSRPARMGQRQGRRAHGRSRQERPAAPDGVSDHDEPTCSTGSAAPRASCARRSRPAAVAEVELCRARLTARAVPAFSDGREQRELAAARRPRRQVSLGPLDRLGRLERRPSASSKTQPVARPEGQGRPIPRARRR